MLELKDCHIGVGRTLYRINEIAVPTGKLSVLIGANGSGKSTLLDTIALGENLKGTICFEGKSLSGYKPGARSRVIALVESRFTGESHLSTQEYLELGRFPYTGFSGRLAENDRTIVQETAAQLNLLHLLNQSTITLSDGERQRAGIGRALIQQTPVILLDEPTSFLDYPNKRAMMQLLKTIAKEQQKVVLLASHDLELCLEFADQLLVINPQSGLLEQYEAVNMNLEQLIATAFES